MESATRVLAVQRLGVIVVAMTFSLMVLGSWVKATGSGLACPDWPACYGQWLPPFPSIENNGVDPATGDPVYYTQAQVLYEWTHRAVASLLGIPLIAFAVLAWKGTQHHPVLRGLPIAALGVLAIQVLIGGATVLTGNPAAITTLHLATATLFFFLVTVATTFAFLRPLRDAAPIVRVDKRPAEKVTVYPGEVRE